MNLPEIAPADPLVVAETAPWWDATRERRLLIQHCRGCGHLQHYPRPMCLDCGRDDLDFVPAEGRGILHSFSMVHRSPDPEAYPAPYTVALVTLAEGPTIFTRLIGVEHPVCDMPVILDWWPLADGRHLPVFTADSER